MPKLVINDKSGKKNISINFFLDDKVIKFKENKKEIENVDYGEHTIKVRTLYFKSSEQKINIEKEVTEIEIKQNYRVYLLFVCLVGLLFPNLLTYNFITWSFLENKTKNRS